VTHDAQENGGDASKLIRQAVRQGASVNDHDASTFMWTVTCLIACTRIGSTCHARQALGATI